MEKIRVSELTEAVRLFLDRALQGDGIIIEDDAGTPRCGVIPYVRPTPGQKRKGWDVLRRLQAETGEAMREAGVTEDDVDRVLREDT